MDSTFEYEGYKGTVNYDKKADYYTGEVVIEGRIYTYEGDTLEELREDFEDIIDSVIAFDEMGGEDDDEIIGENDENDDEMIEDDEEDDDVSDNAKNRSREDVITDGKGGEA